MEAHGLVTRTRSAVDERSVMVELTEKGRDLREKTAGVPAKLAGCLPLSADEARTLYQLLYKVLKAIKESTRPEGRV